MPWPKRQATAILLHARRTRDKVLEGKAKASLAKPKPKRPRNTYFP